MHHFCTPFCGHSVDILCTNLWTFCASFWGHSPRQICDRGFATLSTHCKTFFGSLSQRDTPLLQQGTSLLQHGGSTLPEGAVFLSCSTAAPVWPVFGLLLVSFCSFWAAFLACFLSAFSLLLACLGPLEPALPYFGLFFPIWPAFFPAVFGPLWSASGPLALLSPTFGAAFVLSFFGPLWLFFSPGVRPLSAHFWPVLPRGLQDLGRNTQQALQNWWRSHLARRTCIGYRRHKGIPWSW